MFLSCASLGAITPFLAQELREAGLSGGLLTAALVAAPVARVLLGPAWTALADRSQAEGSLLVGASGLSALGAGLMAWGGPRRALAGVLLFALGRVGVGPLVDGLTIKFLGEDRDEYGRIRRWGSIGFMLAAFCASLTTSPLAVAALLHLGLSVASLGLPSGAGLERPDVGAALRTLLRDPALIALLISSALHFASITVFDSFFDTHVAARGLPRFATGVAVVLGVSAEVAVMSAPAKILGRGPARVYLAALLLGLPRWGLTAALPGWLTVAVQATHGVVFGAFWIAAVAIVAARSPRAVATSAQGLLGLAVGGVGALLGNLIGSWLSAETLFLGAMALSLVAALSALPMLRSPSTHGGQAEGRPPSWRHASPTDRTPRRPCASGHG